MPTASIRDVDVEVVPLPPTAEGAALPGPVRGRAAGADASAAEAPRAAGGQGERTARPAAGAALPPARAARSSSSQDELAASREYLQSIIQDLEAANEELQSANEEILSSNEELQSTNEELDTAKEELQSTNEELNTLNEELHGRNEELSRANSDLVNLLAQRADRDRDGRRRPAHPPVHPDGREAAEPDPRPTSGRPIGDIKPNIDVPGPGEADRRGDRHA